MITKLTVTDQSGKPIVAIFKFIFLSILGTCQVYVDTNCKTDEGKPKCYVSNYEILGIKYDSAKSLDIMAQSPLLDDLKILFDHAAKEIAREVGDLCDANGWALWSY